MKYGNELVKSVTDAFLSGRSSLRGLERTLGIPRKTISRWARRLAAGLPARFTRAAKQVRNRTQAGVLEQLRSLLATGKTAVQAWTATGRSVSLRTVQRWKTR